MAKHKHADLLIAYAYDSSLKFEFRLSNGAWCPKADAPFDDSLIYRIKPEPKKAYVFMKRKENSNSRWLSSAYDTKEDAQYYREQVVRFGYDVTDIKEVEWT
jgi:hypothetical protein